MKRYGKHSQLTIPEWIVVLLIIGGLFLFIGLHARKLSAVTEAIRLVEDDWLGTSADSEGNVWIAKAGVVLGAIRAQGGEK